MEYQNVDLPKVRQAFGGGYIGADLSPQGRAVGQTAIQKFGLKAGDKAIVFGAWVSLVASSARRVRRARDQAD